MATATADKKGMKRICPSCSVRYYDFNKRPVICPNCKVEFTGEIKAKARRARAPTNDLPEDDQVDTPVADKDEDDVIIEADGEDVVSLEEVVELDDGDDEDEDEAETDLDIEDAEELEDDLDEDDEDEDDEDDEEEEEDEDEDDAKPKKKKSAKKR